MDKNKIADYIKIDGVVDLENNPITVEEFIDKFIEWVESNNWQFGGTTGEYKED